MSIIPVSNSFFVMEPHHDFTCSKALFLLLRTGRLQETRQTYDTNGRGNVFWLPWSMHVMTSFCDEKTCGSDGFH